ncbi:MAG: hypothetical protein SFV15_03185 [Polyangiaceae bacterium]|nr:hypothetical protein [Polyangiaceae bacterium]
MSLEAKKLHAQRILVSLALICGAGIILRSVDKHYPLQHWLIWHYLGYWLLTAYFVAGCTVVGFSLLKVTLQRTLPLREMLVLGAPLGLLAYFCWAFVAGLFGLYGRLFFAFTPLGLAALGVVPVYQYFSRFLALARRRPTLTLRPIRPWWSWLVHAFGLVGFLFIYFSILSPNNMAYDARWYHLPLAEQYAAAGRVFRFGEGWVMGSYPQLSSFLYLWAFLLPAPVFDRIELAAHLEFAFVIWQAVALPVLVRRLLPRSFRPRPRAVLAWAGLFLFPGIFLYDSSVNLSADHIAALWAIPIYLALLRAWPTLGWRESLVFAAFLSGAMLTKYTAAMVAIPGAVAYVCRACWLLGTRGRKVGPILASAGTLLGGGLIFTSAHWLKNWLWYGDPLFPQLHSRLTLTPWAPDAIVPYNFDIAVPWHAARTLEGLKDTLRVTATFAFKHHDWPDLHGEAPVFGFLFTVTVLVLPFLGRRVALWGIFLAGHLGVMLWCNISWQDRYLQVLVPWMAAAVATVIALVWQLGAVPRLAMSALLLVQVFWGSDVYFFNTHRIIGSPLKASIDLINTGRLKQYKERFEVFGYLGAVADALPKDAVVLFRESRQTFGLRVRRVTDRPGTQGLLYYTRYRSPADLHAELQKLGVTHVLWGQPEGIDTVGNDLVFHDFVTRFIKNKQMINGLSLGALPKQLPPSKPFGQKVAYIGCPGAYAPGLYPLQQITVSVFDPKPNYPRPEIAYQPGTPVQNVVAGADYIAWERGCHPNLGGDLRMFETFGQRGNLTLMRRR